MAWPLSKKDEPVIEVKTDQAAAAPVATPDIAAQIAEALKPFGENVARLREEVAALKPAPRHQASPELPSVLDNEDAAFNMRLTPILQRQLEFEALYARDNVKREYFEAGFGDLWKKYEADINRELLNSELASPDGKGGMMLKRGNPDYIHNVADMILGRAARENGIRFDGVKSTFFIEGANANSGDAASRKPDVDGLTEKQIRAAKNMNISPADYKKSLERLEIVQ